MEIVIDSDGARRPELRPVEIVERKGLGHPDSLCDALAEALSLALTQFYLDRFGRVLHFNVDKALLRGGRARPAFGGGRIDEPIDIYIAGRATRRAGDAELPIEALTQDTCVHWLKRHMHALDADRHVRIHCLIRPGSVDLASLFSRGEGKTVPLANDTSIGAGFAPLSPLEAIVLAVEQRLNAEEVRADRPAVGEDIKVMAVRRGSRITLTVGAAIIDRYLSGRADYERHKAWVGETARAAAEAIANEPVEVCVNAADGPGPEDIYLTVTGTSAEAGDDGEVGRGNRANGLITPYRPMTMEAVAGKNAISHVGKLYNLAAGLIAHSVVEEFPAVAAAECYLVSQIGRPIDDPRIAELRVALHEPGRTAPPGLDNVVRHHLAELPRLWRRMLTGEIAIDRWPLRRQMTP